MDTFPVWAYIVVLVLLILGSAFFSACETALMRLNRYRLKHLARAGHRGARIAARLLERPDRTLGVILLGNNTLNLYAASVASLLAIKLWGDNAIAIATGVLTFVILIFAEVAPKTLAALKPEPIAFGSSYIFIVLLKVFYPVVWVLNTISNGLLRLFGLHPEAPEEAHLSREELRTLVLESSTLLARRQQMLLGVLELEDAKVEDVMVPRSRIEGIDLTEDWDSILAKLRASRHAHLPLYRERIEDIVGILHVRDLLPPLTAGKLDADGLRALMREAQFVPEGTSLARQLVNFQREDMRCVLVVDEYGEILGLLTPEDVLQEVAGGLGESGGEGRGDIVHEPDGGLLVPGYVGVRTLNRRLGWRLSVSGPRTLNGLVLEKLENLPRKGIRLVLGGHRAEIVDIRASGIVLVRFEPSARQMQQTTRESKT
ncbi:MAG: HlyC/CorC family transporter [Bryobacteraceae bacterium]